MAQVTISSESLDQLFSAACSFYMYEYDIRRTGGQGITEEQRQAIITAIKEASTALGKDGKSGVHVWLERTEGD